jgi:HAD superfamily hydrolase (TIGR01509 family)
VGLDEWQHALGTHGGFDPLDHLDALVGGSLDREAVLAEVKAATALGCEGQPLLPGVETLLRDAKDIGLGRAVASSSSCGWVDGWLRRHRIRDLVDVVVARDDVRKVKPDPELFLLAASRLGVPPASCVVFEDSPNGMRAALAAGMRCVAVPNALTRPLARPDVDLVLGSLADRPLGSILEALSVPEGSPTRRQIGLTRSVQ